MEPLGLQANSDPARHVAEPSARIFADLLSAPSAVSRNQVDGQHRVIEAAGAACNSFMPREIRMAAPVGNYEKRIAVE
jgi:hypothetical protein